MPVITGLTQAKEQRAQESLSLTISRRYERLYRQEIARAMNEAAANRNNYGRLQGIFFAHKQNIEKILNRNWNVAAQSFGGRILRGAQKSYKKFETKDIFTVAPTPTFERMTRNWINENGAQKVTEISGTTKDQTQAIINSVINEAIKDGLSEDETQRLLLSEMQSKAAVLARYRAGVISRTETSAASQAANHNAAKATGLPLRKKWKANLDGRERDTHKHVNGQIKRMDEDFIVGGSRLKHPSDPHGEAKEVINCRCVELIILD